MKSRVKFGVITLYLWESWHICHSSGNFVTVHDFQLLLRNENRYNIGEMLDSLHHTQNGHLTKLGLGWDVPYMLFWSRCDAVS